MGESDRKLFASLLASLHALGVVPEADFDALALARLDVSSETRTKCPELN